MPLPEIDLRKIRVHRGGQDNAFEELCCQLAALENRPANATFHRKGAGADAGVECFVRHTDGMEIGWQVKFYSEMATPLITSLDKSIKTALAKHPDLATYIVCIPFNLSDTRIGKKNTPLEIWNNWQKGCIESAQKEGRKIEIHLWDESAIIERLSRDNPLYSGRILYWFDLDNLTSAWFKDRYLKSCADLGQRYTPETNVDLPIRKNILSFLRDPFLNNTIEIWIEKLKIQLHDAKNSLNRLATSLNIQSPSNDLEEATSPLLDSLSLAPFSSDCSIPFIEWRSLSKTSYLEARKALDWTWDKSPMDKKGKNSKDTRNEDLEYAQLYIRKLLNVLDDIITDLESPFWKLVNDKQLLVFGDGGRGKSHLLADSTGYQVARDKPAILLLGSKFNDGDLWSQILQELDLPTTYQAKQFLGALDAAAEAQGSRAAIFIDALNERNGVHIWKHRLAGFLHDISNFPHISVILSCRTTYLESVIPETLTEEIMPRIEHSGFSYDDARYYLKIRGFVLPGSPNLMPEFTNPLFLKTCCDALEKEEKNVFPKGLHGLSNVFDFYNTAVINAVTQRIGLEPRQKHVERAINALVSVFTKRGTGYMPVEEAQVLFEEILASGGMKERDLLSQLESEGILSVEILREQDESEVVVVHFTFERFSDYSIASKALNDHLDLENPRSSFLAETYLHQIVAGDAAFARAGITEAIAVLLPERANIEIIDVLPAQWRNNWIIREAFVKSFLLRNQKCFTKRTIELTKEIGGKDFETKILISVATEPDNLFNAKYLDSVLREFTMPLRDHNWSIFCALNGEELGDPIETLISWVRSHELESIDEDRARLAAITLTWFLSTTNRIVRDNATKALVVILASRISIALELIKSFKDVNDLYILERLLAASYGAVMQGIADKKDVLALSTLVYEIFFEKETPPIHALLRDHARGIIEYAAYHHHLSSNINLDRIRPTYKSAWPIEHVSDALIESYQEVFNGLRMRDSIVWSCVSDGDFARYIIDYEVNHWAPALLGTSPLPTDQEIHNAWHAEFESWATPEVKSAYERLINSISATSGQGPYAETEEMKNKKKAEINFHRLIGDSAWEDFRVRASPSKTYGQYWRSGAAQFNHGWARRWVCKRAHNMGWTDTLHGIFDRSPNVSRDRNGHHTERIGKKYQWLSLNELLARMSDNLAYLGDSYNSTEASIFPGVWKSRLRDIDPSLLLTKTHDDGWAQWKEPCWWIPFVPNLKPIPPEERLLWRDSPEDRIDGLNLIEVKDPNKDDWLTLSTCPSWRQNNVVDGSRELERDVWGRVSCIIVKKENEKQLLENLRNRILTDPYILPSCSFYTSTGYLGEYPWHPAFSDMLNEDWTEDSYNKILVPIRSTVAEYTCEKGNYDYSIEETVNIRLPAPWVIHEMNIRLQNGRKIVYVNGSGQIQFFDPSTSMIGPRSALIRRSPFLDMLTKNNLAAVWIIAGEKSVFGGGRPMAGGFGGRYLFTSLYNINDGNLVQYSRHEDWEYPSRDQLTMVLGKEPPAGSKLREMGIKKDNNKKSH